MSSGLWSLDLPSGPGSHNSALPQNQAQQGGTANQPGHSLDTVKMPVEKDGSACVEGSGSSLRGPVAEGPEDAQRNPAASDYVEVKDLKTSNPSVDKGPKMTDASQKASLPESKGEQPGHGEKVPVSGKQAGGEQQGGGHVLGAQLCLATLMSPPSLGLAP